MAKPEDTLTLETTKGKVVIAMRPDLALLHVARIKELVKQGFYDGIVFHRVIDGFMAQTGCPQGTGTGGSGKKLKAEFNAEPHVRGTTSMARAQSPDSGDSQFFICFDDAPFLNKQYTAWGNVIEGFMAQTGCPQGTGTGGSGKKLKAEFNKEPHVRGTTSMARAASPDSADSQFFICFDAAPFLNGQYTVWGEVTEGMENVDKIKRGEPVSNPDKIVKATMSA